MSDLQDKTLGCWMGMAVGDALGCGVRGLKQETVHQYFRRAQEGYVDGAKFVGKGIKQYRMPGLYGCQTQRALALSEVLLKKRKPQADDLMALIGELAAAGPEFYFGGFRHADGPFRKAVAEWPALSPPFVSAQQPCNLNYASLAVPLALYHQRVHDSLLLQCVETCRLFSSHPLEISAVAVSAELICFFAGLDAANLAEEELPAEEILQQAVESAERAEKFLREKFPELEMNERLAPRLSATVTGLRDQFFQTDLDGLLKWICENASRRLDTPINNPSQGHALTLFPLALTLVLKFGENFSELTAQCMKLGREADTLGALAGAWGGALLGYSNIPDSLKAGLANAKELKIRGESLFFKKAPKQAKSVLEMERNLTLKESELQKKYRVEPRKAMGKPTTPALDIDFEESQSQALKDNPQLARKFQKEKTRSKRDRRRNLD